MTSHLISNASFYKHLIAKFGDLDEITKIVNFTLLMQSLATVLIVIFVTSLLHPLLSVNNYVNPVYCVATVYRQIHCMYWGHLDHFQRAVSHLK